MNDEIKSKTAADIVAENMQAIGRAVEDNAAEVEDISSAAATVGAAPASSAGKGKRKQKADVAEMADKLSAASSSAAKAASALEAVGLAACRLHELARVWVTSDGQVFPGEGDAKAHAGNLPSKEILKVSAK